MKYGREYPTQREIVYLLGMGVVVAASIVMPGAAVLAGAIYKAKRRHEYEQWQKEWRRFNLPYLKRNLRRLHEQKVVEVVRENQQEVIKLTNRGKTRFLRFKLEELSLKGKAWDGKWRLVMYDVGKLKKHAQENFRRVIKQIRFFPLQKSVYLTPYPCRAEIEYLREYYWLSEEVLFLEVSGLENEEYYKEYFGL